MSVRSLAAFRVAFEPININTYLSHTLTRFHYLTVELHGSKAFFSHSCLALPSREHAFRYSILVRASECRIEQYQNPFPLRMGTLAHFHYLTVELHGSKGILFTFLSCPPKSGTCISILDPCGASECRTEQHQNPFPLRTGTLARACFHYLTMELHRSKAFFSYSGLALPSREHGFRHSDLFSVSRYIYILRADPGTNPGA